MADLSVLVFINKWRNETDKTKLFFELTATLNQVEVRAGIKEITTPQQVQQNPTSKYHLLYSLSNAEKWLKIKKSPDGQSGHVVFRFH